MLFSSNQIIFEPKYEKIIRSIISEYSTIDDYKNDENNYFNNIYIIFYTKTKPDSLHSTIKINGKYYMSMNIEELRNIIKKCYDADQFSNELLTNIIRYLPITFFEEFNSFIPFKRKNINIKNPSFNPNNRDNVIILDDLNYINLFIKNYKNYFHNYELKKLLHITMRFNASKNFINKINHMIPMYNDTSFLLKDKKNIMFDNIELNNNLSKINNQRQDDIRTLYNITNNEYFLSNDVLYKFILSRTVEEWEIIIENNIDFFKNNGVLNELKSYEYIYKLFIRGEM